MNTNATPANVGSNDGLGAWVPAHERVPAAGTECVVLLRYTLDRPPFVGIDTWDVQREDPTGMGGPTMETGESWNDNDPNDVIAWIAVPPHPPAEWDQRLSAPPDGADALFADYQPLTPGRITYGTLLAIVEWRNRHGIGDVSKDTVMAYQEEGQTAGRAGLELGLIDYGQATGCEDY